MIIKDLDSGEVYDLTSNHDRSKLDLNLHNLNMSKKETMTYLIGNFKIKDKINTKFFKLCERGDINKILLYLERKVSDDRKPDINEKFLHGYTVLHTTISNGIY